jgi:hypothetical protein
MMLVLVIGVSIPSSAVECAKPPYSVSDPESHIKLVMATIAMFATAHSGYQESPLSPEMSVRSIDTHPLAKVKACVDQYMPPFQRSKDFYIKSAADQASLAMSILEENEADVYRQVAQMSAQKATADQIASKIIEIRDGGLGRWFIFTLVAVDASSAISRSEKAPDGKYDEILTIQPDEALLLRLEILKNFSARRLSDPKNLRPSPEKGAAFLYQLLTTGKVHVSDDEWK